MRVWLVALAGLSLAACVVDGAKVPTHDVFGKDGQVAQAPGRIGFAVVGSTRGIGVGARAEPEPPVQTIADVRGQIAVRGLDFVLLTGGYVRRSTADEWSRFGDRWKDVVQSELKSDNKGRKPVIAIPGDAELLGDRRLEGFGGAFPGVGAGIGFNRNASWGLIDVDLGKTTWRILLLDTHQKALGSRWQEQLFWLPKAVKEGDYDKLIVVMPDPRVTLADGATQDPGDAPTELIDIVEEYAGLNKLTLVISGGPQTNELILPTGAYGEAYLVAANAGLGMPTLMKAGPADEAGYKDIGLEPLYVAALQKEFDRRSDTFSEDVIDQARGRGAWEGYIPRFDGAAFPIQGWWAVEIVGSTITLRFRMRRDDGTFFDAYAIQRGQSGGWTPASL
jgi:hypothetical protein